MNKYLKVLSLLGILSLSGFALGHTWNFTNITDKILVVQMGLMSQGDKFFNVVGPGQKTSFDWSSGYRSGLSFEFISIGEYDETKAKSFPGTNSPKLPKEAGKNILDTKKITSAIDARGEWFNSLDKIPKNRDLALFILEGDRWNNLNNKLNSAATKLMTGASIQQTMTALNINIPNDIKSDLIMKTNVPWGKDFTSGSPLNQFKFTNASRDFFIVDNGGKLALVTKK